jgi:HAD superfamily hydrolase (TIGR01509 family)
VIVIKALIFDFDGLILDTESPEVQAWQEIFGEFGQEFPLQLWIREVVGSSAANFDPAAHLAAVTGRSLDLPGLHARARAFRLEQQARGVARPGVEDYLAAAGRLGLRLAIASSSKHAWVEGYLRQLGLGDYFDVIIAREDAGRVKPEPDLFLAALAALGIKPGDGLVFEDSPNGVLAARRAGIRVVAVPNPITAQMKIDGADLVLDSLAGLALPDLLERLGEGLVIRPETPADIPAIRAINLAAFGQANEAGLVDLIRGRGKASLSLVAVDAGRLLAHVLFSPVTVLPSYPDLHGLGLGPVAVLPEAQRTGIGSRLIRAGLQLCREQGCDFVVLVGNPAYYSRFGFTSASGFGLGGDYGEGEHFMACELRPGALSGVKGMVKYIPEFREAGC